MARLRFEDTACFFVIRIRSKHVELLQQIALSPHILETAFACLKNPRFGHPLMFLLQLFKADPSGWYAGYRAAAIGQKGEEANNIFEKKLRAKPALPANEPIVTGLIALQSALGVDLKANEVEVGVCSKDAPRFKTLSEAEVLLYTILVSTRCSLTSPFTD